MKFIVIALAFAVSAPIVYFKRVKLGLDLKGGSHFVLEVEPEKAIWAIVARTAKEIREELKGKGVEAEVIPSGETIKVKGGDKALIGEFMFEENFVFVEEKYEDGVTVLVYRISEDEAQEIKEWAVEQALETIRGRIDQFGVVEPAIFREGDRRVVVQLPGIRDPERAKKIIGKTALLEFRLLEELDFLDKVSLKEGVRRSHDMGTSGEVPYLYSISKETLERFVSLLTSPSGTEILLGSTTRNEHTIWRTYIVRDRPELTGDLLRDARVRIDTRYNTPYIAIKFSSKGARIFEDVTGGNVGRRLAIVLDGKVYSAPVIRERIIGGNAIIEGDFTIQEARDLAVILRAGALPAPVRIEEERTVGPSLGQDSIRWGLVASVVAAIAVLTFMLGYYRLFGFFAWIGLAANITVLFSLLSMFDATLTLPGIAGVALTLGMAVDNNIIVFERIREELRKLATPRVAVENGYKIALRTILDANITTLVAAIMLFQFGTGPVRGFAVTLSAGILTSIFGAVFVTKTFSDWAASKGKVII